MAKCLISLDFGNVKRGLQTHPPFVTFSSLCVANNRIMQRLKVEKQLHLSLSFKWVATEGKGGLRVSEF